MHKKVLVTGATGFLGSHLICFLAGEGKRVIALKREQSRVDHIAKLFSCYFENSSEALSRIEWVVGDVLNETSLEPYVREVDAVYHCAALVSFAPGQERSFTEINVSGVDVVCSLALKYHKRICFVSSIAALGDVEDSKILIDEQTPLTEERKRSLYSKSKLEAEEIIWRYISKGLDAVIVNPGIILGSGVRGRSSVKLFEQAARGIPFYTLGVSGYVDVRDVCEIIIRLTATPEISGDRFVLCGGNYSYKELFSTIAVAAGRRAPYICMTPLMTEFVWRFLRVISFFTRKEPLFTRETARSAQRISRYSSAQLLKLLPDYSFYTLEETALEFTKEKWSV